MRGLPLLSLDREIQRRIVGTAFEQFRLGSLFIQFTYGPVPLVWKVMRDELTLGWARSERIWGNVPPATPISYYRRRTARRRVHRPLQSSPSDSGCAFIRNIKSHGASELSKIRAYIFDFLSYFPRHVGRASAF